MKKILVVEDDAAIRTGLAEALVREHYQVQTAADGDWQNANRRISISLFSI